MKKILSLIAGLSIGVGMATPSLSVVSCADSSITINGKFYSGQNVNETINQLLNDLNTCYGGEFSSDDLTNYVTDKGTNSVLDSEGYYHSIEGYNKTSDPTITGSYSYYSFRTKINESSQLSYNGGLDDIRTYDEEAAINYFSTSYDLMYYTNFSKWSKKLVMQSTDTDTDTLTDTDADYDTVLRTIPQSTDTDKTNYNLWSDWTEDVVVYKLTFALASSANSDDELSSYIKDSSDDNSSAAAPIVYMRVDLL